MVTKTYCDRCKLELDVRYSISVIIDTQTQTILPDICEKCKDIFKQIVEDFKYG